MTAHAALLRAVNLGGHNKVSMAALRALLGELGLENPTTLLQSGNVVFEAAAKRADQLESLLEDAAKSHLGLDTDFFVRTAREWKTIVAGNPFPEEARRDPGHLLVFFLKDAPDPEDVADLQKAITGRERVRAKGRHAYAVYPDGIGRSRLTHAVLEKQLGTRGTGRNWNTILKLDALLAGRTCAH